MRPDAGGRSTVYGTRGVVAAEDPRAALTGIEAPTRGPESITVPGAVRLWADAAAELGRLPLATLLEPARELAERGFAAGEVVSRMWKEAGIHAFLPAPRPGEIVRLPDLARTLGAIAEGGPQAFYEGEIAN